jgi:erythromycin esterase
VNVPGRSVNSTGVFEQIRSLARPLTTVDDPSPLVERLGRTRFVGIGEASHGTREYYRWRALLTRHLIEEHGFSWIGVEGDWPDCWRINRWVRGLGDTDRDVRGMLARFERWPAWMGQPGRGGVPHLAASTQPGVLLVTGSGA